MRSADRLLDAIHAARQKRMPSGILVPKQLKPIYRDIQDHYPEVTFSILGPHVEESQRTYVLIKASKCCGMYETTSLQDLQGKLAREKWQIQDLQGGTSAKSIAVHVENL